MMFQAFQMSNLIREYMEKIVEGRERAKSIETGQTGPEMTGVMSTE